MASGGMSDDDQLDAAESRLGERAVQLRVAARPENLAVLRMLVGAVATFEDLSMDTVADLRLAVDEMCTQLIRCAVPGAALTVLVDADGDEVSIRASAPCVAFDLAPGSFSWHVLTSLADRVEGFRDGRGVDGAEVFGVALTTHRPGTGQ